MFNIDIEKQFNKPNTALRIEVTSVRKRPCNGNDQCSIITDEMIEYALKDALKQLISKEL